MFHKFYNPARTVAIIGLVFALASFTTWAGKAKPKGDKTTTPTTTKPTTIQTYLASDVIGSQGGSITITRDVVVKIPAGALNVV